MALSSAEQDNYLDVLSLWPAVCALMETAASYVFAKPNRILRGAETFLLLQPWWVTPPSDTFLFLVLSLADWGWGLWHQSCFLCLNFVISKRVWAATTYFGRIKGPKPSAILDLFYTGQKTHIHPLRSDFCIFWERVENDIHSLISSDGDPTPGCTC